MAMAVRVRVRVRCGDDAIEMIFTGSREGLEESEIENITDESEDRVSIQ